MRCVAVLASRSTFFRNEAVATLADFVDFASPLQMLQDSWKIATTAVFETHSVRDLAHARRICERSQIRQNVFVTRLFRTLIVRASFVFVFQCALR